MSKPACPLFPINDPDAQARAEALHAFARREVNRYRRTRRRKFLFFLTVLLVFLLSVVFLTYGKELPDSPKPQPVRSPVSTRFFDRHAKIAAGATVGLLAWDSAQTCNRIGHGGHEDWIRSQNCGVIVTELALNKVAFWGAAYFAHRARWHKLEYVLEWCGPAGSATAIGYSYAH